MARRPQSAVYDLTARFWSECIEADGSLLFNEATTWTLANLEELHRLFVSSVDTSKRTFQDKLRDQLTNASIGAVRLAAEVILIHFLFPSTVKGDTKRALVCEVLGWRGDKVSAEHAAMKALDHGIGSGGQGYNTRRAEELAFVINLALRLKRLPASDRVELRADHRRLRALVDDVEEAGSRQFRHMFLHLLFPEHYERIASGAHKGIIQSAFRALVSNDITDRDERLLMIRQQLQALLPGKALDFYESPLVAAWYSGDEDTDELSALDGLLHKKQIVLYGPPGTGKTHQAKALAGRVIHAGALRRLGAGAYFQRAKEIELGIGARVHRMQLHPGYSYEDFIRGLHIGEGGKTEYRPGALLRILEHIKEQRQSDDPLAHLPHVLILDEMNRTDLSRLLGECFSLLEDRGSVAELPGSDGSGQPLMISLPEDLYVIGTMNLIDQSIEQVDFALRRRFLWYFCGFSRRELVRVCAQRWKELAVKPHGWDVVRADFERLDAAAAALNKAIRTSSLLGEQYEIGHTYFFDTVSFLRRELEGAQGRRSAYLWRRNEPEAPVRALWRLSLAPLLAEYLRGLNAGDKERELARLREVFFHEAAPAGQDE